MEKRRVLIITQEMEPYTSISDLSDIAARLPLYLQTQNTEMRLLMPRYGSVNERRHRLHEVVRLSGMNIIVNDDDYPLVIKVASMPTSRQQVYFLDNEDFFKRKAVFEDAEGKAFQDNTERMVFFCKGAIETVRKFGWAPDVIHCMGWMTSLIPLYLRVAYRTEPLFEQSKIVYSLHDSPMTQFVDQQFADRASINNLITSDLDAFYDGNMVSLNKGAVAFSDGVIFGNTTDGTDIQASLENEDKPFFRPSDMASILPGYLDFYDSLTASVIEQD
jgi:starch synthase